MYVKHELSVRRMRQQHRVGSKIRNRRMYVKHELSVRRMFYVNSNLPTM